MDGILLVDKPKGWTSHDVVAKIRGLLRESGITRPKVGHTGTLDPAASGLLVLVVGRYTKRAGELAKLDKTYEVTMRLGATSTTGDAEGEITPVSRFKPPNHLIKCAIAHFIRKKGIGAEKDGAGGRGTEAEGRAAEYWQTPPAYSAVKVGGQRAYRLARRGQAVELKPRLAVVYKITSLKYDYPLVRFAAEVSSGTYIRSLVEDIGARLGTGAYLAELRRTRVGRFELKDALALQADTKPETIQAKILTK